MAQLQITDVPILVETPSRGYFPMVRCSYIYIECDDPLPGWSIGFGNVFARFSLLELVGIVQQPIGADRFNSYNLVDGLFEWIEGQASLLVNFGDIWMPNFLFKGPVHVGQVYRASNELFRQAFRFRNGQQDQEQFERHCKEFPPLEFSPLETNAFEEWVEKQFTFADERYPKNRDLQLRERQWHDRS
jgi:hypothetical protein